MITVDADIGSSIKRCHFALVPSQKFSITPNLVAHSELFRCDWRHLEPDPCMADGGDYRSRRYGVFQYSAASRRLTHMPGTSYHQSIEINPLNGGEHRQFAPLDARTINNPFLHAVIQFDFAQLASSNHMAGDWLIGVHQIRIIATPGAPGNPTPEGTHRDDEKYTSQHLMARHNIDGGINYFYGNGLRPTESPEAAWEQQTYFDSYYFDSSLWHSVSPIVSAKCNGGGHRDVLLIDFVKPSRVN